MNSSTPKPPTNSDARSGWRSNNGVLKACIFATGLSGIVAEYVMSTLASYLLGNSVLQWTMTVSMMLFAMGVGSTLSRFLRRHLLDTFIAIELLLSLMCGFSATTTYLISAYWQGVWLLIYGFSFGIGLLIGLEIPIATRLNDVFEDLRVNISSVMEKDYYGALLGGLIFAFVALPYLGLTYTPIILGMVNFLVAAALFWRHRDLLSFPGWLSVGVALVPVVLIVLMVTARPIVLFGEQQKYVDKVIYQTQTPYQRIVITQWRDHYWLYLNGNEQFSSYDEERYHEPLVHPAMAIGVARERVLILGGGDGLAARELLKYPELESLVLVDLDPEMTRLGRTHPLFQRLNENALEDPRVRVINHDAYAFLKDDGRLFDVIIVDLPDPNTIDLARLYSQEFYQLARRHLSRGGILVTQAGSPFFSREAFLCTLKTIRATGMPSIAYHNHVPTLGEWGWVLAINAPEVSPDALRHRLREERFETVKTRYLNKDAMAAMLLFGKGDLDGLEEIRINKQLDLALYNYYRRGAWGLY